MVRPHSRVLCLVLGGLFPFAAGCHSAMVDSTVQNRSGSPISLLEVDYPSASFGTQNLADGADFHYRFKKLGNGPLKLTYTDSARHDHSSAGPEIREGSEGLLTIFVGPSDVRWQTTFRQK
jgi:hypothetical protein